MKCFAAKPERGARKEFLLSITIYFFKKTVFIGYIVCLHRILGTTIVSSLFKINMLQELLLRVFTYILNRITAATGNNNIAIFK